LSGREELCLPYDVGSEAEHPTLREFFGSEKVGRLLPGNHSATSLSSIGLVWGLKRADKGSV